MPTVEDTQDDEKRAEINDAMKKSRRSKTKYGHLLETEDDDE